MTYVFRRGRMGVNLRVFRFCMIFPCVSFVKDVLGGGRINYKCHTGVSLGWFEAADEADISLAGPTLKVRKIEMFSTHKGNLERKLFSYTFKCQIRIVAYLHQ